MNLYGFLLLKYHWLLDNDNVGSYRKVGGYIQGHSSQVLISYNNPIGRRTGGWLAITPMRP